MYRAMVYATVFAFLCSVAAAQERCRLLLDWWPNPNHVPLFAAYKKGFFKKHGLDVEILTINDAPDVVSLITLERADIGLYYMPQAFVAAETTPIKMLAPYIDSPLQGFLLRAGCTTPKTVGGFPCALFSHCVARLSSAPKIRYLHGDLAFHIHSQTVDAVFGVYKNIEGPQLKQQGIKTRFIGPEELGIPSFSELVFITKTCSSEKATRFLRAVQEGIAFAQTNPEEAFSLYAQAHPDKSKHVLVWEKESWEQTVSLFSHSLHFETKQVRPFFQWLQREGIVQPSTILETSFSRDAVFTGEPLDS